MDGNDNNDPIFVEDFPRRTAKCRRCDASSGPVQHYFETMGNPIVAGRGHTWDDVYNKAPVVLISENFARELLEGAGGSDRQAHPADAEATPGVKSSASSATNATMASRSRRRRSSTGR